MELKMQTSIQSMTKTIGRLRVETELNQRCGTLLGRSASTTVGLSCPVKFQTGTAWQQTEHEFVPRNIDLI